MPRSGWRKSESDRRLPDLVSVGLLMKVFPAEVVDAVVAECGRTEKRHRSLPARSMVYFAMGMALHSEGSYEDVLALISDGLAWADRQEGSGKLANKAAISHARSRLGPTVCDRLLVGRFGRVFLSGQWLVSCQKSAKNPASPAARCGRGRRASS